MCQMFTLVLLASVCAFAFGQDQQCAQQIDGFHQCMKDFFEAQKAAHAAEKAKRESDMKSCFKNAGCKEPTFDEQKGGDSSKEQCHKQLHDKVQGMLKDCVSQKTGVTWPYSHDEHDQKRGHFGGHGDHGHDQLKTLCSTDKQQNDTKACMKNLFQQNKQSKDSRMQEAKDRFQKVCDNKRTCFAKISPDCQTKFNKTRQAVCDCTNSQVMPHATELDAQAETCKSSSGNAKPNSSGEKMSFSARMQKAVCGDHQDKCDKPFQASGEHKFGGHGSHGGRGGRPSNH